MSHPKNSIVSILSLLATPLLLFLSNAAAVYLRNQADLGYQWTVVLPFAGLAVLCVLVGMLLLAFSRKPMGRLLLWVYYLAGPLYLLFTLLRGFDSLHLQQQLGFFTYLLLCIAVCGFVAAKRDVRTTISFFAFLSLLLVLTELARIVALSGDSTSDASQYTKAHALKQTGSNRPNIYHLILDEFQTEAFQNADQAVINELNGFQFYPDATTLYDMTVWSVPSVFIGNPYEFDEPVASYQNRALNSSESAMYSLREAGYAMLGYARKLFPEGMQLMHVLIPHASNIEVERPGNRETFVALWVYSSLPFFIAESMAYRELFINRQSLENLKEKTFLASSSPQESYLSFQNYLQQEEHLPARGRYTFIHLLIPHGPYVYKENCEPVKKGRTNLEKQSACALNLLAQFVTKLKELGRYDESMILVHGDHGARGYRLGGKWRSPYTLLLAKSVGAEGPMVSNNLEVSLPDIAGTLKEIVASEPAESARDVHGLLAKQAAKREARPFFRVRGEKGMVKHVITNGALDDGEKIMIPVLQLTDLDQKNIPMMPLNKVFEAEDGHKSAGVSVRDNLEGVSGRYLVNGTKTYSFELDKPSSVVLEARVITPNGNSDSNYIRLNGNDFKLWPMKISNDWHWVRSPRRWQLQAGRHIFSIEYREPIYLDQLKIITREITPESKDNPYGFTKKDLGLE